MIIDVSKECNNNKQIVIGHRGENGATIIQFDFSAWRSEFGDGSLGLAARLPRQVEPYVVALETDGTISSWTVSSYDTQINGQGAAQVVYIVDGVVKKSQLYRTYILDSIEGSVPTPPDPYETYIEQMMEIAADTYMNAQSAADSATNAAGSAGDAAGSARDASGYADNAAGSARDASGYANAASGSATAAETDALKAEGFAVGEQGGEAVGSGSPYYHSNAEYYSDQAGSSATSASGSATSAETNALKAEGYAVGKQNGTDVGDTSPYYHNNAEYYATSSAGSAQAAAESAAEAAQSASVFVIDPTLTHSGQAADAKVTGDELSDIRSDLNNLSYAVGSLTENATTVSGLYINDTGKLVALISSSSPDRLICVEAKPNRKYCIKKTTATVMRAGCGSSASLVAGNSLQSYTGHVSASSDALYVETNSENYYIYIHLFSNTDDASLQSISANIGSLVILEVLTDEVTNIKTVIDNGSLYADIMGSGSSNVEKGRQVTVEKNLVKITNTSGSSSVYVYCNIFDTPIKLSTGWNNADLSNDYFCPLGFDVTAQELFVRVQWNTNNDAVRNRLVVATKNNTSGVITKGEVCSDKDGIIQTINLTKAVPEIATNGNFALYAISQNTAYLNTFKYWLFVSDNQVDGSDIVLLNSEAVNRVRASNWYWGEHAERPTLLNLLHFSDIHGWAESLRRVVELRNHLESEELLTDAICTGDIQKSAYGGNQFQTVWRATPGTDDILFTLGNHDVYQQNDAPRGKLTEAQKYAAYYDGYTTAMGITMGANTSYWYKDYADQGIRLIGVDPSVVDTDSDQKTWLEDLLVGVNGAKTLGYAVIIASHYLRLDLSTDITSATIIDNDWSNSRARALMTDTMTYDWAGTDIVKCVSDFVDAGGKFICYIIGHTHTDILSYPTGRPDQLIVNVCAAAIEEATGVSRVRTSNDLPRVEDTVTRDAFNLITVDTSSNLLKCVRFGANINMLQKSRTAFVYDYSTHTFLTVT